ncbi:hypothetical protein [Nostoc mirabile]|uniref:hypothetical protein n=1 Tax=Nostoc mirabile TaxID=2907820 RepID=UPI001E379153|nr:hypothetical protein [Nostoc mirabile]
MGILTPPQNLSRFRSEGLRPLKNVKNDNQRQFGISNKYLEVVLRYLKIVLRYSKIVLRYSKIVLRYLKIVLEYLKIVLRYFKLCRTAIKYTGATPNSPP